MPLLAPSPTTARHWVTEGAEPADGLVVLPGIKVALCVSILDKGRWLASWELLKKVYAQAHKPHTRETPRARKGRFWGLRHHRTAWCSEKTNPRGLHAQRSQTQGGQDTAVNMESSTEPAPCREATGLPGGGQGGTRRGPTKGEPRGAQQPCIFL